MRRPVRKIRKGIEKEKRGTGGGEGMDGDGKPDLETMERNKGNEQNDKM